MKLDSEVGQDGATRTSNPMTDAQRRQVFSEHLRVAMNALDMRNGYRGPMSPDRAILTSLLEYLDRPPDETTAPLPRPRDEWHEDTGPVLWWHFPIVEPPFCGTPLDTDWPIDYAAGDDGDPVEVDYCTHWTLIPVPVKPWPLPVKASDSYGCKPKRLGPVECGCPARTCQPQNNIGRFCWRSGCPIYARDFPDSASVTQNSTGE